MTARDGGVEVAYILFNAPWEAYLERVGLPVSEAYYQYRPLTHRSQQDSLLYLRNSIFSLLQSEGEWFDEIVVYIVELDGQDDNAELIAQVDGLCGFVRGRGKRLRFDTIAHQAIRGLIDIELQRHSPHRSPNKIHEAALFRVIQRARAPYLYISDIDTVYFQPGFFPFCLGLVEQGKIACAYLDKGSEQGDDYSPDRMHTVSLFFATEALRQRFDLAQELARVADFDASVVALAPGRERDYFVNSRRCDTLSFFTVSLQKNFSSDLLAAFNDRSEYYFEDAMLVLGNEYMFHAKYFYPNAMALVRENYPQDSSGGRSMRRMVNMLASLE